ncbi:MAG TPA: hypothetical protein VG755_20630 [Nannocystaceae bacterium]|nr:hypothetical protein [Nannocystaceae bacterium]
MIDDDAVATNDRVIAELARTAGIYTHASRLVEVVDDADASGSVRRHGAPRVHPIAAARLEELISHHVDLRRRKISGDKTTYPKAQAPRGMAAQILARSTWPKVRHLVGIIEAPTLRADGSLLDRRGYDSRSGLLLLYPSELRVHVPAEPTREDGLDASKMLLELLRYFPADSVARSAWLSALLTAVARDAIDGPVPAVLFDANAPATGKGLLAGAIGIISTGRPLPIAAWSSDADESRKLLLSIALSGDRMLLFDNLIDELRSGELDAALTSRSIRGRLLGFNAMVSAPFDALVIFTGNNVSIAGDLYRRILYCRLKTADEHPEQRELPDFLAHLQAHRGNLLGAALTILRAYVVAGRPKQRLPPWGSFERWSDLIRGALKWLGLPDPAAARDGLRARADRDRERAEGLLIAWASYCRSYGFDNGQTIGKVRADLRAHPESHTDLRAALESLDAQMRQSPLGRGFAAIADRVIGGMRLVQDGKTGGAVRWKVESIVDQRDGFADEPPDGGLDP